MKNTNKVLILGATGGIGGEIARKLIREKWGNDSNLLIVFYVHILPDDLVIQLHRF